MTRLAFALATLVWLLTIPAAPALAVPIDQASWTERKRHVALPNGVRLAYVELGDPDGSPVLLLHGYTDSSRVWTILAPWLERPDEVGPVLAAFLAGASAGR